MNQQQQQQQQASSSNATKLSGLLKRSARIMWRYKKTTLFAAGLAYFVYRQQHKQHKQSAQVQIIDGTMLAWRIHEGSIIEAPEPMSFELSWLSRAIRKLSGTSDEMSVLRALMTLEMAAADPRIKGLVVKLGPSPDSAEQSNSTGAGLGIAQVQELRQALEQFRAKKEEQLGAGNGRTYFYTDSFDDQLTYYLASAFSDIIVQPTGQVPLTGLSGTQMYFKDLLDKIGVKMHVEARKEYKSVVGPYSESSMPEKHRENMMDLLSSLNDTIISDIATSCGSRILGKSKDSQVSARDIVRLAMEEGPIIAPDALSSGLVSALGYTYDVVSIVGPRKLILINAYADARRAEIEAKEMIGGRQDDSSSTKKLAKSMLTSGDKAALATSLKLLELNQPVTVGVVYLLGGIERFGSRGAKAVCQSLLDAAKDPTVSAIVMRIDSGGGDVIASDTIGAYVDYVQEKFGKPVVASYGNVSASGAYYASTSCKRIFASPGTITGSIGVASMRPVVTKKLLETIGTNVEELYTIDNTSDSIFREPEGASLERYRRTIDIIYDDFKSRVAKGRGYTSEQVEEVARGRVFTGTQALQNGLVDELGSFTRAIEAGAQMGFEARVDIANKLAGFFSQRIVQIARQKAVAAGTFESLDKAQEDSTFTVKVVGASDDPDAQTINDGALKGAVYKNGTFKADLLKNVKVKVFPEQASLTRRLIAKARGLGGDGDGDDSAEDTQLGSGGATSSFFGTFAKNAVRSALAEEIESILSSPSSAFKSAKTGARFESDDANFK
ncbi:hypothetical protein FBU59_001057 [Linderina macrospora]|uniref:Uncharacterized protein n=1 Tax=Linderina macrospora TaxID=4868 RepID=A0ACC1JFC1_9FUNG|nr:hypothetical protein FBU59_001057 [Linderina macrospora]